jgi:hypothetical protein
MQTSSSTGSSDSDETDLPLRKDQLYYVAKGAFTAQRKEDEFKRKEWLEGVPKLKPIEQVFKEKGGGEIVGELKGAEMVGWAYDGPFDELPAQAHAYGIRAPYTIVFHSAMLESMQLDELRFVMGQQLGRIVYGFFHHEPLGLRKQISWWAPPDFSPAEMAYYAAQGNAQRVFFSKEWVSRLGDWRTVKRSLSAAIPYIASGGFSGPQLYPRSLLPALRVLDRALSRLPAVFATRLLVALEKK